MATVKLTEAALATLRLPTETPQAYYWDTTDRGLGVVVGRTGQRTLVVRGWAGGKQRKVKIGVAGQPNKDGHPWTVKLARIEARKLLGQMADGKDPNVARHLARAVGPTLRGGLKLHVTNMRKRGCSERSIETIENELPRLLETWMDRPIAELTGAELAKVHDALTAETPYAANRVVAQVSAVWNALDRVHELAGRNPARAVTRNRYMPSRERVADDGMPAWLAKVNALSNPVRRDLQLFCLFTGMRSEAARQARWEHVDEKRGSLVVPRPKGGEKRAFTLPLPSTVLEMFKKRRRENRDLFGPYGGDGGWIFASLSRSGDVVQPVAEPKEYRLDEKTGKKAAILPGLHTLRRTYLCVAAEAGVSELDRHVLANHAYGRQNVNATYIEQAFGHLAACQATIEAGLWKRLRAEPKAKRAKLRAV